MDVLFCFSSHMKLTENGEGRGQSSILQEVLVPGPDRARIQKLVMLWVHTLELHILFVKKKENRID